jgi:hypothetical protein
VETRFGHERRTSSGESWSIELPGSSVTRRLARRHIRSHTYVSFVNVDLHRWLREYETGYDERIRYMDSGEWNEDATARLTEISSVIQSRDPPSIAAEELVEMGRWKAQSRRLDRWLSELGSEKVRRQTRRSFQAAAEDEPEKAAEELTELKGVGVPVASSVLAMFDPERYAVIDFRVLRALGFLRPGLINASEYDAYSEFLDHFRAYNTSPETYDFYMKEVRQIEAAEDLSSREVDMALWAFDEAV